MYTGFSKELNRSILTIMAAIFFMCVLSTTASWENDELVQEHTIIPLTVWADKLFFTQFCKFLFILLFQITNNVNSGKTCAWQSIIL